MNVVLVSDVNTGGAATALRRLYSGLQQHEGIRAAWVHCGVAADGVGRSFAGWPPFHELLLRRLLHRFPAICDQIVWRGNGWTLRRYLVKRQPEIVNFHNLHDAYTPLVINRLPRRGYLVWTLHDMWPLTGYCCYSYNCRKYEKGCVGDCPEVNRWGQMWEDPSRGWLSKELFCRRNLNRLAFVSPSRWLAGCARTRVPGEVPVSIIPNGLPLDVFKPIEERRAARVALGLPLQGSVVLCGSQNIDDPRKGTGHLINAMQLLSKGPRERITVVAFGHAPKEGALHADWVYTGTIRDEALLNLYYNAADVFVLPSLADNLPNTLIEATAAGTPCVTFDVGGCPEIVRDGETGFVARAGDAEHLADCIAKVLDMGGERRQQMSEACRRVAVAEYDVKLQAQRYMELFKEMVERGTGRL